LKIVKPSTLREQKEVLREVEALQILKQHPHIIKLQRVIREDGFTCLIQELGANGDLFERVLQTGKLPEKQARHFFRQLVSAVQYCHAHMVVHRDLKPENVLIDQDGNVKISDFGLSNIVKPGKLCSTFCGSPIYCPPEVVLQQQYCGTSVDVWSLGVILYVMVTGGMPWRLEQNVVKNMDDLIAGNFVIPDCLGISPECRSLIKAMLTADSCDRATMDIVASHPWVNMGYDCLPPVVSKPLPLILEKDIQGDIMRQLIALGKEPSQARHDIQFNPTSPTLLTYHVLLEKLTRATKLANVNIADCAQSQNTIPAPPSRQRASSLPQNRQPQAEVPKPVSPPKERSDIENDSSILHNLVTYFGKLKKTRKPTSKDSVPIQHNSPTHSPNTRRRNV